MSERLDITRPLKLRGEGFVYGVHELPQPWVGGREHVFAGYVQDRSKWTFETWTASGRYLSWSQENSRDLVYDDEPEPEADPDPEATPITLQDLAARLDALERKMGGEA